MVQRASALFRPLATAAGRARGASHARAAVCSQSLHGRTFSSSSVIRAQDQEYLKSMRNIGISAHIDSGKTTLTERILFYTGRIHDIHEVRGKDGVGAKMDSMELEREKGITIQSAATFCKWKHESKEQETEINIIDTPGHVDFTIEVERALRVLDGAVLVCCGVGGVQSQTITVDRQMKRYGVPRVVFVNKLDRYGADPFHVLKQIRAKLGITVQPIQLPIGEEDKFVGVCDVITKKAHYFEGDNGLVKRVDEIPAELKGKVDEMHAELLEALADHDDDFAEVFLESDDGAVPESEIHAALRRTTLQLKLFPMLMGSAYKNKGVQDLLDAVTRYLPSPLDRKNLAFNADDEEEEVQLRTKTSEPLVGHAFKIQDHPLVGQVTYMRLYQGKVAKGDHITNMLNGRRLSIKRLVRMHSNDVKDVQAAGAGDIIALAGVECDSGVTFTDGKTRLTCSSMFVPDPVMSLAVSAERDDQPRFQKALKRFQREDPTFTVAVDEESKETIISGMGELHLDIYCERMRREYNVNLKTGEPKVNYRETIKSKVAFDYTHKRQSGGRGQYGKVQGFIEPVPEDEESEKDGIVFVSQLTGNEIPPNYVPSIEKGFRAATAKGLLSGHQVINTRVVLEDGQAHDVDSSDQAFQAAAAGAFESTYRDASPQVLEPLMRVEVTFPTEFQAQTLQTLNQREGAIQTTTPLNAETSSVLASVPLRRMFGYSSELRSVTQGQGEFAMEFEQYEMMNSMASEQLMKEYQSRPRSER